jgi:hypothetical protein
MSDLSTIHCSFLQYLAGANFPWNNGPPPIGWSARQQPPRPALPQTHASAPRERAREWRRVPAAPPPDPPHARTWKPWRQYRFFEQLNRVVPGIKPRRGHPTAAGRLPAGPTAPGAREAMPLLTR